MRMTRECGGTLIEEKKRGKKKADEVLEKGREEKKGRDKEEERE
jgi:hypothetical protein